MDTMGEDTTLVDVDEATKETARARGQEWAIQLRAIITPSSLDWPWAEEKGLQLANAYVLDLTEDPAVALALAALVLKSARESWSRWRARGPRGTGAP
jgi:hypothetical protein